MSRADDRGYSATTRVPAAPRVTLNWLAEPFTSRGKEDTKWIREKNGRRVLRKTSKGGNKATYWRAPRPRPSEHRRRRRGREKAALQAALGQHTTPSTSLQPQVAVQVLQSLVRESQRKQAKLKLAFQEEENEKRELQRKQADLQAQVQQLKEEKQVHAHAAVIQQSARQDGDFDVGHNARMQQHNEMSDMELVQYLASSSACFVSATIVIIHSVS